VEAEVGVETTGRTTRSERPRRFRLLSPTERVRRFTAEGFAMWLAGMRAPGRD
jgi:hypothetical protein